MPTRNIILTNHHQDMIEALIESGRYRNTSEVLREGLRLVEQREREDTIKLEALRRAAQVGLADLATGRFTDIEPNGINAFMAKLEDIQRSRRESTMVENPKIPRSFLYGAGLVAGQRHLCGQLSWFSGRRPLGS